MTLRQPLRPKSENTCNAGLKLRSCGQLHEVIAYTSGNVRCKSPDCPCIAVVPKLAPDCALDNGDYQKVLDCGNMGQAQYA